MDQKIDFSKIYSPSKIEIFSKCPKSYHFHYLDPVYSRMKNELKKRPDNIWKFYTLGKAVHNAITLFYYLPPKERTESRLLENLKETWRSEVLWDKKPPLGKWGGFKTVEGERNSYRQAISMLKNFLKMAKIEPEIEYLPTQNFRRSMDDYINLITPLNEEFDISGKFDLITGENNESLRIIDFKTGKSEDDDGFQLRFYKILTEAKFRRPVEKASLYFLKTGSKKEFDLGKEKTEKIKEEVLEKIRMIKTAKNFEPKPSKLCRFCLFRTFCLEKEKDHSDVLPF